MDAESLVRAACGRGALTPQSDGPVFVVAAGKAAGSMLAGLPADLPIVDGLAAAPPGERAGWRPGLTVVSAGHPAPDAGSAAAGARALALARSSAGRGRLLVLLSGGASAMLACPAEGLTLDDKIAAARQLMHAGAAIHELNCVRKHLSRIKGGQLAAAAGRTLTLSLSDVHAPVADDPSVIGSGPTVPDPTTFADALAIARHRRIDVPAALDYLARGVRGEVPETIKPDDPRLSRSEYVVVGNRQTAMAGARAEAELRGYHVVTRTPATTGEARETGPAWVAAARRVLDAVPGPVCVIGSGETTVTVQGSGRGGRNQEFVLAAAAAVAALAADAKRAVLVASAGTDGVDGPTDAAGAVVDPSTVVRARAAGRDIESALRRNDTYDVLDALGDLVRWGPTGTNVGDLHVLVADRAEDHVTGR